MIDKPRRRASDVRGPDLYAFASNCRWLGLMFLFWGLMALARWFAN